jgi:hypothetical protein
MRRALDLRTPWMLQPERTYHEDEKTESWPNNKSISGGGGQRTICYPNAVPVFAICHPAANQGGPLLPLVNAAMYKLEMFVTERLVRWRACVACV